jgi:hypothetical protein
MPKLNNDLIKLAAGILRGDVKAFMKILASSPAHKDADAIKKEIVFRTEIAKQLSELSNPTPGYKEFCKGEKEAGKNYNPPSSKVTG